MDKSLRDTFALALLMGLVLGVRLGCVYALVFMPFHPNFIYIGILQWVGFAVHPFLIFTVFYFHGRKLDLKAKLKSVIVLLFLGLYAGNVLGHAATLQVLTHLYESNSFFGTVLMSLFPTIIISAFFVALSASAIAYIRNIKNKNVKRRRG